MKLILKHKYILIFLVVMQSCFSKLKITVEVFDKDALKKTIGYKELPKDHKDLVGFFSQIQSKNLHTEFTTNAVKEFEKKYSKGEIKISQENKKENIKKLHDLPLKYSQEFKENISKANKVLLMNMEENIDTALSIYYLAKNQFLNKCKKLAIDIEFPELYLQIFQDDILSVIDQTENYAFGQSVITDPLIYIVGMAPDKYWSKYKDSLYYSGSIHKFERSNKKAHVNTTLVKTKFGNSDVAVKMDSPGNFIVKGARVDSDEAIKASFKVLNQGIKYMAYSSGIPVSNADGSETKKSIIPELAENDKLTRDYKSITHTSDAYTWAFINSLIIEVERMENGDTTAVGRIKKSFSSYQEILKTNTD